MAEYQGYDPEAEEMGMEDGGEGKEFLNVNLTSKKAALLEASFTDNDLETEMLNDISAIDREYIISMLEMLANAEEAGEEKKFAKEIAKKVKEIERRRIAPEGSEKSVETSRAA
jgi:hypothetical protein